MSVICKLCQKEVIPGQPIHGLTLNHWSCTKAQKQSAENDFKKCDATMTALGFKVNKRRRQVGEGRVGKKLTALLIAALEKENGGEVTDILLWNQPVGCRSGISDLAYWGGHAKFNGGDRPQISFHSWNTMTACIKTGQVRLDAEDNAFDVSPKL